MRARAWKPDPELRALGVGSFKGYVSTSVYVYLWFYFVEFAWDKK